MGRSRASTSLAFKRSPLIPALVSQIGKRLGLGPLLIRRMMSHVLSEETKRQAFQGYRPTEKDVFAAVFGKSGTNWMMQIATQIAHHGKAEFDHIHDLVPWPDAPMPLPVQLSDPVPGGESPTGLRVIKTHNDAAFVPYNEEATYLSILRDPKEVLVSGYYFIGGILDVLSHVDINTWVDIGLEERGGIAEGWAVHANSFWRWRDRPNVLVLSYPEIKRDPRGCIERVADCMQVQLSAAAFERVLERSSFEYMRRHESRFAPPQPRFAREADRPRMVRSGRTGASGEELSYEQQVAIDTLCMNTLNRLESTLPYKELFEVARDSRSGPGTDAGTS